MRTRDSHTCFRELSLYIMLSFLVVVLMNIKHKIKWDTMLFYDQFPILVKFITINKSG